MTDQRRAIEAAFQAGARPLSPAEVLAVASEDVPRLNLTTVYRNLKSMVDSGELVEVAVVGQAPRYELAGLDHHHHFLCESCDRLFDLPGCPSSIRKLAPGGFEVTGHDVLLTGRCESCA